MTQESGWPAALPGVLNPIDDPYAAAQQMAVALVASGKLNLPQDPVEAADAMYPFLKALTEQYCKLRQAYDLSEQQAPTAQSK